MKNIDKTDLYSGGNKKMLISKKKRKTTVIIVVSVLCCIGIITAGILVVLSLFNKDTDSYTFSEYNSFTEGFTDVLVTDEKSAIEAVGSVADVLGITDAEKELKVVSVNSIDTDSYYRMQQYYNDIPVYGRTIVISADKNNNATALTSNFIPVVNDISLNPTAKQKDLNKSVQKYFNDNSIEIPVTNSDLVLYQTENGNMVLSYEIIILSKRIIIDANTAEILSATNLYVQEMVECKYKDRDKDCSFQGIKLSENEYQIGNDEKGIFVFNANYNPVIKEDKNNGKTTYNSIPANSLPMTSVDNYFGNDDSFASEEYAKAVYMLNTLQSFTNYYNGINTNQNTSVIVTINNSFEAGTAFGSYVDIKNVTNATVPYKKKKIIAISFGQDLSNDIYGHLDTLGHEYMHGINHSYFKADKDEALAIDEAYADIFGEILESRIKSRAPDWIHGQRNMVNPHEYDGAKYPYPASLNDLKNAETFSYDGALWYRTTDKDGTDFSHFASTLISHCAYLMWNGIDGTEERIISESDLGEIWYRSLLYLQDNADFEQCRNAVELSARAMLKNKQITEEQYKTVVTAFDTVGIENATFTYKETVKNNFELKVLNSQKNENVHFNLEVIKMPTIKIGLGITINEMPELVMEKKVTNGYILLELKDGTYGFRITDASDESGISQPINFKVVVNGNNSNSKDEITINTDFTAIEKELDTKNDIQLSDDMDVYSVIIDQYKTAIKNDFYDGDNEKIGKYVSQWICWRYDKTKTKVYYSLIDINNDGIKELTIGSSQRGGEIYEHDIFTHTGKNLFPLFKVGLYGDRHGFKVYDNGIICTHESDSATVSYTGYYKLQNNKTELDLVYKYVFDNYEYYKLDKDGKRTDKISDEVAHSMNEKYESDEVELDWKEITFDDNVETTEKSTTTKKVTTTKSVNNKERDAKIYKDWLLSGGYKEITGLKNNSDLQIMSCCADLDDDGIKELLIELHTPIKDGSYKTYTAYIDIKNNKPAIIKKAQGLSTGGEGDKVRATNLSLDYDNNTNKLVLIERDSYGNNAEGTTVETVYKISDCSLKKSVEFFSEDLFVFDSDNKERIDKIRTETEYCYDNLDGMLFSYYKINGKYTADENFYSSHSRYVPPTNSAYQMKTASYNNPIVY